MASQHVDDGHGPSAEPASQSEELAIARRLALMQARVIGLLPTSAPEAPATRLLLDLGVALSHFVPGEIGLVGDWTTWNGRAGGAVVEDERHDRIRWVVPPPCPTAAAATASLEEALATHALEFSRVLVDLARYARPTRLPDAADRVQGLVLVVRARRTKGRPLVRLASSISPERLMGSILVD